MPFWSNSVLCRGCPVIYMPGIFSDRVLRHLGAEAVRQAAIDQNEVDLERREQQYRRRFFALNVTWNPSHSNAVRISS
jgi:hypothetical protein